MTSSASFRSAERIAVVAFEIEVETIEVRSTSDCETPSNSSWKTERIRAMPAPYVGPVNRYGLESERKVNRDEQALELAA
jgi:hypothetical protein